MPVTNKVSKSDFHSALRQQFRNDGVLDEITASVRATLLLSLLEQSNPTTAARTKADPKLNAVLSLLYHFLEQQKFPNTLSVFVAETKLNSTMAFPLPQTDAIKKLGLQHIWNDASNDLLSSLQDFANWVPSQHRNSSSNTQVVSKEVQTEEEVLGNVENNTVNTYNPTLIYNIERECQHRMQKEMNEKLKLSSKRQAIEATRRLEQKYKETLASLRNQIEAERTKTRTKEDELEQQQILAQSERNKIETQAEKQRLEKQSLQNEIDVMTERVKEIQMNRFNEHEQVQLKTRSTLDELATERHNLQMKLDEVQKEKNAMLAKEREFISLTHERSVLIAEIEDLRAEHASSLAQQQSSYEQEQAIAKDEIANARNEITNLRKLLRTSQTAIEAISFRDIGKAAKGTSGVPAMYNRSPTRTAQFGPTLSSLAASSMIMAEANDDMKSSKPSSRKNEELVFGAAVKQQQTQTQPDHEADEHLRTQDVDTSHVISHKKEISHNQPEDPPCSSAKDPPENDLVSAKSNNSLQKVDTNDAAFDAGQGIILNISAITEEVYSSEEALLAEASVPSHVDEKDDVMPTRTLHSITKLEESNVDAKGEIMNEDGSKDENHTQVGDDNEGNAESINELLPSTTVYVVQNKEISDKSRNVESNREQDDHIQEHTNTNSVDSEQYSQRFSQTFVDQDINHGGCEKQENEYTNSVQDVLNSVGPPSRASASTLAESDGYSESFCS